MVDKAVLKWGYGQRLGELSLLSAKATTGRSTLKEAQCLNLLRTGDYRVMLRVESRDELPLTYKLDYQLQELYAAQEASCQ
jgi:hypothetical protein